MTLDAHTTEDVRRQLLELKDQALAATKRADGDFYRGYLADDTLAITPFGVFGKDQVVGQMSTPSSSFRSSAVSDVQAIPYTADCGLVTYRARYPSGDVLVSTLYLRREGAWQGVFYQQTPVPPGA
jgi:hypothetical protein